MHVILCGLAMAVALFCSLEPLLASVADDFGGESSVRSGAARMSSISMVTHFAVVLEGDEVRYASFPLHLKEGSNADDVYEVDAMESIRALSCMILEPASDRKDNVKPGHCKLFLSRTMERNTIVLPCLFKGAKIHYALTRSKEFEDWMDFCVSIEGENGSIYRLESWVFPLEDSEYTDEGVVQSEVFDEYFTKDAVLAVLGNKERLPLDHGSFMINPKESLGEAPCGLTFSVILKQLRPYGRDPLRIDIAPLAFKFVSQDVYETDSLSYLNPYLDGVTLKIDIKTLGGESYVFGSGQNNMYDLMNNDVRAYSSLCFILTRSPTHFHLRARLQLSPIGGHGSIEESQDRYIASFPRSVESQLG